MFKKILQKLCVIINRKMIVFFYINNIIICYRKKNETKARAVMFELQTKYTMNVLRSLKWFLDIHILQDKAKKLLWLSQETYVNKMTNQFAIDMMSRLLKTSSSINENREIYIIFEIFFCFICFWIWLH